MNVFQAAVLGLVQGLSEFLPISSSGHLALFQSLMGISGEGAQMLLLSILLHAGTLVAVLVVFWKDWLHMLCHPIQDKTLLYLFLASLPALAVKLVFDDKVDALFAGTAWLGIYFLITAALLLLIERVGRRGRHAGGESVGLKHAAVMGCFQAVAILPGVSRSGSTLLGGVASGLTRERAAKFSFMMSAPAILGSLLVQGKDALESGYFAQLALLPTLVGMLVAAVSGYLTIRYMLRLINKISFNWFALYVGALAVAVIVMQIFGLGGLSPLPF